MKLLICGDRNWTDKTAIKKIIQQFNPQVIIEGEAKGADILSRQAAEELNITVEPYRAKWKKYGRAAGPIRNTQQLKEGKPDIVIGFHNNINESKGTQHMLTISKKAGVTTYLYTNGQLILK